jgi:hypothetical protein
MNHKHEKRLGVLKQNLSALSCAWARVCGPQKPNHLLFKMKKRYCIKCNRSHWFFLERIDFEANNFDSGQFTVSELEEMGYFDQFQDAELE